MTDVEMDIMRGITHLEDAIRELQTMDVNHPQVKLAIQEIENSRKWLFKFLRGRENQKIRTRNLMKDAEEKFEFEFDPAIDACLERLSNQMDDDAERLDLNNRPYSNKLVNTFIELGNICNRLIDVQCGYDTGVPAPS